MINVKQNKERFIQIVEDFIEPEYNGEEVRALLDYLETTDFYTAPASSQFHSAVEGGLVNHSLMVYDRLNKLMIAEYGDSENWGDVDVTEGSMALAALFHDLCKANSYVKDIRNKKVYSDTGTKKDEMGRFEWVAEPFYRKEEQLHFGHGAKSVFIIQNFIHDLGLTEAVAIRFHMGGFENPGSNTVEPGVTPTFATNPLALLLHLADMQATFLDEGRE